MNNWKISGFFLIGVGVLLGSWLIFKTNFSAAPITSQEGSKNNFKTNIQHSLSSLNQNQTKNKELLSQQLTANNSATSTPSTQNLTEEIGKSIASKILGASANLLDYKPGEELSPEEKQISDDLADQLKKQNYLPLNQPIDEKNLKIGSDSIQIKIQYIEDLDNIVEKCFEGFNKTATDALTDIIEKNDPSSAKKLSEIYECCYKNAINLQSPSLWLSFHKDLLNYYQNAKIIYEAMSDYQNDPLKAYLAANAIKNLIDSANQIQAVLEIKAQSVGYAQ